MSSSPGPPNQELNDTKKQRERREKGGEAAVGGGQVWNWFCVSACSEGLSYTRESEGEEEEETAGVFETSLPLSVSFSFSRCLLAA